MERIKLSLERGEIDGCYVHQTESFILPWFNSRLEIKIDKIGKIIDSTTGKVIGEFKFIQRS